LDAFVSAQAQLGELRDTVVDVVHGQFDCPPAVMTGVVARIQSISPQDRQDTVRQDLTIRETEILYLLSEGLSNKEIASRLDISVYTVKNHVHNLLVKMEVPCRRQAIVLGVNKGFLQPRRSSAEPTRTPVCWITR
jgi:DNA-binding NarL/FixJ family response regulator